MPEKVVIAATLPGTPYAELLSEHRLVLPQNGVVMEADELSAALPDAAAARKVCKDLSVPVFDVNLSGYPSRMREWNEKHRQI